MAAPRRLHTSTGLLVCTAVFACGKGAEAPPRRDAAAVVRAPADAAPVAEPTDASESSGRITISVEPPRPPGSGFAKRCAIGGPPLATPCGGRTSGIAIDRANVLYLAVDGREVRRFAFAAGDPCKLEPDGAPIDMPPENPRPQKLGGGPVYMRSGGLSWSLVATPEGVYALDFLAGLFRIDRGKPEPACTELFGFQAVGKHGKRWLGRRKGIEEIVLGKRGKCTAKPAEVENAATARELFVVKDQVFTGVAVPGARICSQMAMTACGDGACLLDHNCRQIVQLDADGNLVRTIAGSTLFDSYPYWVGNAVTTSDGTVVLAAIHRDLVGDKEACELAIYAVPPAVFAR